MFRIAICDDVKAVCDVLKSVILSSDKLKNGELHIDVFNDEIALIEELKDNIRYDLIFLDIELGEINGVEVGHVIRDEIEDYNTKIVYISGKNSYDRQLFDVQPLTFISKPIEKEKVIKAVLLALKISNRENKTFKFISFKSTIKVPYSEILYFESYKREIKIICVKETYRFYGKMEEVKKQLPDFFIQPHRSYIVNYEQIKQFKPDEIITFNGDRIPISQSRRRAIKEIQIRIEKKRMEDELD